MRNLKLKLLIGCVLILGAIGIYVGYANWHQNNYDFYAWKSQTKYAYYFTELVYLYFILIIREKLDF